MSPHHSLFAAAVLASSACSGSNFDSGNTTATDAAADVTVADGNVTPDTNVAPPDTSVAPDTSAAPDTSVGPKDTAAAPDTFKPPIDVGGPDTFAPKCGDPTTFPTFEKGCTTNENCAQGLHQINCCGSMMAVGFNHAEKEAFELAEKAWAATCPKCGCPTMPTVAEDGKTGATFVVNCIDKKCMTTAK